MERKENATEEVVRDKKYANEEIVRERETRK